MANTKSSSKSFGAVVAVLLLVISAPKVNISRRPIGVRLPRQALFLLLPCGMRRGTSASAWVRVGAVLAVVLRCAAGLAVAAPSMAMRLGGQPFSLASFPLASFRGGPAKRREVAVVWDEASDAVPTRRTIRSRFTEFCVRGWVREQVARSRLRAEAYSVEAAAPERCSFDGAVGGRRRRSTVCADVIQWRGENVSWFGLEPVLDDDGGGACLPKLKLSALKAEITNLHTRVLTRGRRGSLRATATISGRDVDDSTWVRGLLDRVVRRVLEPFDDAEELLGAVDFETTVQSDAETGEPRVRMAGTTGDGNKFSVSLRLVAENGALALRAPIVFLDGRRTLKLNGLPLPATVVENIASVYLSTVAVDASASSGSAFAVADVCRSTDRDDAVQVTLVSSAASQAAMRRAADKRRKAEAALGVAAPPPSGASGKKPEWRLQMESLLKGAAPPLRHTFVVGERLPWIFNPRTQAPFGVTCTFAVLSLLFKVTAVPDNIFRGIGNLKRGIHWTFFRPRLARKYRRGDGLGTSGVRRYVS